MSPLLSLGHDLEHTSHLLGTCRSIADAQSVSELQRRIDHWLARVYAPAAWMLACTLHDAGAPLIAMHGGTDNAPPCARDCAVGRGRQHGRQAPPVLPGAATHHHAVD